MVRFITQKSVVDESSITCSYCGESIDILIDSSVAEQQYFEDCSVCCCPIWFDIVYSNSKIKITVKREDD